MNIDLKQPVLVLAGRWNPHIFSLDWMAVNLFEIEAGVTVEVGQAMSLERPTLITYLNDVGISCTAERLEFFATDIDEAAFGRIEAVAEKTLALLSHTPVFAIGANFRFFDSDVDARFSDSVVSREGLEAKFKVASTEVKTALQVDGETTLNLTRLVDNDGVSVAWNYHHSAVGTEIASKQLAGILARRFNMTLELMDELYGQTEFDLSKYGAVEGSGNDE